MAETLAGRLVQESHVALTGTQKAFIESLDQVVTDELSIEDRLNSEVGSCSRPTSVKSKPGKWTIRRCLP